MPSNRTKYSEEMREQTAKYIMDSGKSATSVAEELGIDTNTVCRWVRDYIFLLVKLSKINWI